MTAVPFWHQPSQVRRSQAALFHAGRRRSVRRCPGSFRRVGEPVRLQSPSLRHRAAYLGASRRSRRIHHPWVKAPTTNEGFAGYLEKRRSPSSPGYLIFESASDQLVGVVNFNEVIRSAFQSAFLGYYVFAPFEGRGYMQAGMRLALREGFTRLRLHRVEANIQPENVRSIALARRLGFLFEGLSPRYLKVGGRWRDHERWALLAEDWQRRKGAA